MTDPSTAVRCSAITKSFPAGDGMVEVLHGIDFDVPAGELTMLVGPSGCGKTTLISIIAGILTPTSGEVEISGNPLTRMSDAAKVAFRRSNVGFIFQQYNLLPALRADRGARCRSRTNRARDLEGRGPRARPSGHRRHARHPHLLLRRSHRFDGGRPH
jgi:putative ABC transport system ATP-binding protein